MKYDPMSAADSRVWIGLGEGDRIDAVSEFHKASGEEVPNEKIHAILHVVVENQLALGEAPVQETLGKLLSEGLDRHDAIHAIASVLARHMYEMLQSGSLARDLPEDYYKELERLTAESWRSSV